MVGQSRKNIVKMKRAWLLTWERDGDHVEIMEKLVAIISCRFSDNSVQKILEQYFVSSHLALHEQFAYVKSRKNLPYDVKNLTIPISKEVQIKSSMPPQIPTAESMMIGGNPWLWARIVYDLETWLDNDGVEYLEWKDQEVMLLDDGNTNTNFREKRLKTRL